MTVRTQQTQRKLADLAPATDVASFPVRHDRDAGPIHIRQLDGSLEPVAMALASKSEFFTGGGLFSTGPDYLAFLRMPLNGDTLYGVQIL